MPIDKETFDKNSPDAEKVNDFHRYSDLDSSKNAQHHRIGRGDNQAAAGSHNHREGNGESLLEDHIFTGSRSANLQSTVLPSILAALVKLGATDNTVP